MPALLQPAPRDVDRRWRAAVLDLRRDVRRVFAPRLHVGTPGGEAAGFAVRSEPELDAGARIDVCRVLIESVRPTDPAPEVWLTRPGVLDLHDLDTLWLPAAVRACGEAGLDASFVVVTREGWRDPRSGAGHRWVRLRARAGDGGSGTPG